MDRETSWAPAPDSGISIEWIEANGLTFEVATAGEGDRLALCLHGFPELHYSWRHQMPLLAEKGYRVWAPNMRGYGQTTRPPNKKDYRLDNLTADVGALIDASGAKEVTLLAHDWGAIVAWQFAIQQVRPLTRLIIMNVPHPLCARRELKTWKQLKKSWYMFFFQIPKLPEIHLSRNNAAVIGRLFRETSVNKYRFTREESEPYRKAAAKPGAITAMLNYYRALFQTGDARKIGDGKVHVPTLIVWGEQDIAIDIACLDGTDQYVDDLTVRRFPNASHWVQQDIPDEVNAALKDWLPAA
ncbi:alpha/beta fold hydrolase [Altererythrobacter sp.]|uniref:alpha/beta fold hydrolase n=1 Tax=Altererythrobacter sp. TaxID=1872480 RepID=UPI001B23AC9E|nr:alpha/beta fold hydrolase [Altererythrobacter sp.]MBO6608153.1 alpha/beta fold hydrolase [Altererythrobacter sp.]MBO6641591.1 alpha/beta fold hydrolase [Altererythrobacter sp.]MBO6707710.1 alpha/beta fold hydrolase [Altererythrobacter sp.]